MRDDFMSIERVCSVLAAVLLCAALATAAPAIYVGPNASAIERSAAMELQRCLYAVQGQVIAVETAAAVGDDATGLVVGTEGSLPDVGDAYPFGLDEPRDDGYVLHTVDGRLVVVAAATPCGAQNGVYGLLANLGFGFYLGSDTFPESVPTFAGEDVPEFHVSESPVFSVRGSLPWYNFFDSPTAWELEDHKAFVDSLVRMRCNFIGFHTYDFEPFAAYEWEGSLAGGEPLANTSQSTWGTHPLATEEFFAGTGRYFARDYFGAASSFVEDRTEAILAAKEVLRQALTYAKARGLRTCLGFELSGDPMNIDVQNRFEARLKALLADYPMLDYVWLWQPEGMGAHPAESPAPRSQWESQAQRWAKEFAYLAEPERRTEAVRLALFGKQAYQILHAVRPDVTLVMSGWGGDQWLKCTDLYRGLDVVLPGDVVFSALDNIAVTPSVSEAYGSFGAERVRWPIVWFEYDGDQWMPQPNLRATAGACRDALAKGCQGLLGIHWRTRAVAESAAYCAQFAWNPDLTAERFCGSYARHVFGQAAGEAMSTYIVRLQDLGYRWVGGSGQPECGRFTWSVGDKEKRAELTTIHRELQFEMDKKDFWPADLVAELPLPSIPLTARLVDEVASRSALVRAVLRPNPRTALEDLVREMDYVLMYDEAAEAFVSDGAFDARLWKDDVKGAAKVIENSALAGALHTYARRIKNKGELGVLATINAKAWADLKSRGGFDTAALERLAALPKSFENDHYVLALPDRVIAVGVPSEGLRCVVKARPLGGKAFVDRELECIGRTTFAMAFPEALIGTGNVEYGIEIGTGNRMTLTWPEHFPARMSTAGLPKAETVSDGAPATEKGIEAPTLTASIRPERYSVVLAWTAVPGVSYSVSRDGEYLGAVFDGWFEDVYPRSGAEVHYAVTARNVGSGKSVEANLTVSVPELPLPGPPEQVRIDTRANRIVLGWDSDDPAASQYYVLKYDQENRVIEETYIDADFGNYLQMSDQVNAGVPYSYTVAAVTPDGRIGTPSKPVGIISSTALLEPAVRLSFEDDSHLAGLAQLANNALALGGRGWAELPPQPEWDPDHALTLAIWVKLEDLEGMPVLICKGAWQQSGYFLQILNKQIRFFLAGVDTLDAGKVQAGEWQHIVATFGFNQMRVYVNGEEVGRKRVTGHPRPSATPLLVGRYGVGDDVYFVRGFLDDIRIYIVPLTPDEVRALYEETKH